MAGRPYRSARRRQQQRLAWIVIGVAAVAVIAVVAILTTTGSDAPTVEEVAGSPTIAGDALPRLAEGTDPTVGQPAPVVTGADFDGRPVTIGDAGTPQLVMFLASWCPACQAELPLVVDWVADGNLPDGVELVAVSTGLDSARPNWPPQDWLDDEGYTGSVLVDDAAGLVATTYGLSGTPFWVFIDADGNVFGRASGMFPMESLTQVAQSLATGN